ncbi:S-adenosyl-L-methionine-dependent methyltransferase [Wilcoxina mikolae CBS 423.85]|nr:S-adenosyl-L-methionine-dependent methyltransferase [Wilcoxina mikolae CBS 423.85]
MAATILEQATKLLKHAESIHQYIEANNLTRPSFDQDAPLMFPLTPEIQNSWIMLLKASKTIYELVAGPRDSINWAAITFETAVLRAIDRYDIPEAVPVRGEASFASIASATGLPETFVTRIIRYAATSHIFYEHSRDSTDEGFAEAAKLNEAVDKYGDSEKPNETAFNVAFGTDEQYFTFLERPDQQRRQSKFADYMRFVSASYEGPSPLLDGSFDWGAIGDGVVVDIGGGVSHVSTQIAHLHPKLRFVVQDLPAVVAQGTVIVNAETEVDVASRISFMEHNFWEPQPVKEADVYFLRGVLYDWADKPCINILRNIIPAMKKGGKILIMDRVLPEPSTQPKVVEKLHRALDLTVLIHHNGRERARGDWEDLVSRTDSRLGIVKISTPLGSRMGLIELELADMVD